MNVQTVLHWCDAKLAVSCEKSWKVDPSKVCMMDYFYESAIFYDQEVVASGSSFKVKNDFMMELLVRAFPFYYGKCLYRNTSVR